MSALGKIISTVAGLCLAASSAGCLIVVDAPGDFVDAHALLRWSTEDAWTGHRVDCHDAGADHVRLNAYNLDTGEVFVDLWSCGAGSGTTAEITAGDYAFDAELVFCGGEFDCTHGDVLDRVSVGEEVPIWGSGVHDLGHAAFRVDLR